MGKQARRHLNSSDHRGTHTAPIADFNPSETVLITQFIVPDPERLRIKLGKCIHDGCQDLEILSDFDHTLSRYKQNGQICHTSHRILQLSGLFTAEFEAEANRLFKHYHAIELDPCIDFATKFKEMDDWWDLSHGMIAEQLQIYDFMLPQMMKRSNLLLRHGIDDLLEHCKELDVPFTVVSAGIGNFVEAALRPLINYQDFRIHSNFLQFDEEGHITGFSKPNIHSLSKNVVLRSQNQRRNVLLLGDMPTDTLMVQGNKYETVINVGFLNDPSEDYRSKFDLLVVNDGNLDVVEQLVAWVARDEEKIMDEESLSVLAPLLTAVNVVG